MVLNLVELTKNIWEKLEPISRNYLLNGSNLDFVDETKAWDDLDHTQKYAVVKWLFEVA